MLFENEHKSGNEHREMNIIWQGQSQRCNGKVTNTEVTAANCDFRHKIRPEPLCRGPVG